MKDKLLNHFKRWKPKTFLWSMVLILLLLDLGNGQFLRLSWLEKNSSMSIVNILASQGELSLSELSHDTMTELLGMIDNTFLFFLFIVLINNLFFYLFTLRGKAWAHSYLVFYTFTGALFSLIMVIDSFGMGSFWGVFNIASILMYVYLFLGLKLVPFTPKD
jgi:hypothetical protein